MRIIIGSTNPAKIKAIKNVFNDRYCIDSIEVSSGVSLQPFSDDETIKGAINRATNALQYKEGDIGIGLEGGVLETSYGMFLCNWGALVYDDFSPIIAGGARILLPNEVASRLIGGDELGPIMDEYARRDNISKKEGAIGVLTNGKIDRAEMFTHVAKLLIGQFEYHYGRKLR